jgi:RimJ/RimL family protein N-acetyltransferase
MSVNGRTITDETIEVLARSLYREAVHYGFQQIDYLRFVNQLLDMSTRPSTQDFSTGSPDVRYAATEAVALPLENESVRVRAFDRHNDTPLLEKWLKDRDGRYFFLSRTTGESEDLARILGSDRNVLGTITLMNGSPIGVLAYLDFDREQRKAELRKLIGEVEFRGRGFAKKATELWIAYGIGNLRLRKIYLSTLDTNARNIRLNEELGFKVEGILRDECYFDGASHDVLRMGLLCNEVVATGVKKDELILSGDA